MNTMAKLREDSVSSAREFRIGAAESHWTYHFERTVDHPIGGEVAHQCCIADSLLIPDTAGNNCCSVRDSAHAHNDQEHASRTKIW